MGQEHRSFAAGLALFSLRGLREFSLISSQTLVKNLGTAPWERQGYKGTDLYSCLNLQLSGPEEAPADRRMERPTCSWSVRPEKRRGTSNLSSLPMLDMLVSGELTFSNHSVC